MTEHDVRTIKQMIENHPRGPARITHAHALELCRIVLGEAKLGEPELSPAPPPVDNPPMVE